MCWFSFSSKYLVILPLSEKIEKAGKLTDAILCRRHFSEYAVQC